MTRIATIAVCFAALASAAFASADAPAERRAPAGSCALDAPAGVLTVVAHNSSVTLRRRGDEVVVRDIASERECAGGTPTVQTVDLIRIDASIGALVTLDLRGGPFAPGRTAEGDGSPEIEFEAALDAASIRVEGTNGPDAIAAGLSDGRPAVNLNADERVADPDLVFTGPDAILQVIGSGGDDTITARAAPAFGRGFMGSFAARAQAGDDVLVGSSQHDSLKAGSGTDRVRGLGGNDSIYTRDHASDLVRCGPGRDAVGADHIDRLVDCE
jgi:hypothetical protein